jgi:hypothetical protein
MSKTPEHGPGEEAVEYRRFQVELTVVEQSLLFGALKSFEKEILDATKQNERDARTNQDNEETHERGVTLQRQLDATRALYDKLAALNLTKPS